MGKTKKDSQTFFLHKNYRYKTYVYYYILWNRDTNGKNGWSLVDIEKCFMRKYMHTSHTQFKEYRSGVGKI